MLLESEIMKVKRRKMRKKYSSIIAIFVCSIFWLGGCGKNSDYESTEVREETENVQEIGTSNQPVAEQSVDGQDGNKQEADSMMLPRNPEIHSENPEEENMADLLQTIAAGTMVQVRVGNVIGSGVLWEQIEDKLIIVTAAHVLTMGTGEIEVTFVDGWSAPVVEYRMTEMDLAFLVVDMKGIPEESMTEYYLANVDAESAGKLQKDDGIILMASGTGTGADAYEGRVIEPWIYVEDFAQHMILVRVEAEAGMSGGGLFDYEGHFLGILCGESEDREAAVISLSVINGQYDIFSENF